MILGHPKVVLGSFTEYLEPSGEAVLTDRFPAFQEELRTLFPNLTLAFDRKHGLWSLFRRHIQIERVAIPGFGNLVYARPIWDLVSEIAWISRDHLKRLIFRYREPDGRILANLIRVRNGEDASFLEWDRSPAVNRRLRDTSAHDKAKDKTKEWARDVANEYAPFAGRPLVSVPRNVA